MTKFFSKLDLRLVAAVIFLLIIGLVTIASGNKVLFYRQFIWALIGLGLVIGLPQFNLKALFNYRWFIFGFYFAVLLLLIVTYFLAPTISGAKSWLVFGPVQIQPSEFMKAALIILFSSFFAVHHISIARLRIIAQSFIYFIIPASLVLLQPDLGTSLVLFGIWFSYLLISELPRRFILISFFIFVLVSFFAWGFALAPYQKARIIGLFKPETDPLGINYSVLQSKIAIGSAGIFGKGFGQGTQVQLGFLPQAETDFIFATFVEEWGFLGGLILILVFLYLIYRILQLGLMSLNNFARFFSLGTVLLLLIHFLVNLGSTLGLLPVVGIGLPFVSYGGSNLLTASLLLGILQGVSERKIS